METTRAKVIEKAVGFEEIISQILSLLLDIDKNSSISLGYKNTALSFNHKINLLVDLKFIPKEVISDFQLFAEIRNKFAHVLYVDTFIKCFELIPKSENNFLKNLNDNPSKVDKTDETNYASSFDILCFRLGIWLRVTLKMISDKKKQEIRKITVIEMIRHFIKNNPKEDVSLNDFLDSVTPIIDEIIPDEDFIKRYQDELLKLSKD